jgi:AcrR family transcriptional regulator
MKVWYQLVPSQGISMSAKEVVKQPTEDAGEAPVRQRIMEAAFSAFMEKGFAETSTLEIATRARASKRELYAHFASKQEMLAACIGERAKRLRMPADWPDLRDRETLARVLTSFGGNMLREIGDPTVVAVFRLAITEAIRTPEVAIALNEAGIAASRMPLREIMTRARAAGLLDGEPGEMAEHFFGLLWGSQMMNLLLRVADRPSPREIARRAEAATATFLRAYPAP